MRRFVIFAIALAGCASPPPQMLDVDPRMTAELDRATDRKPPARSDALERALLPPVQMAMPSVQNLDLEPRFDLVVTNASAAQVFTSIVSGTRYSLLVHPAVSGTISVNLKDVTVEEALSSIRDLYGYEYRIEGNRIIVHAAGLQTRVFQVNYLPGLRRGSSDIRVRSGALSEASAAQPGTGAAPGAPAGATPAAGAVESSRVRTEQQSDFWTDLRTALTAIVGAGEGRSVVITPHSGVVVVSAFPPQLRAVEQYLRATRLSIERQVMLEAKILEVTLSEEYQAGINWQAFRSSTPSFAVGQIGTSSALATTGQSLTAGGLTVNAQARNVAASAISSTTGSPVFGLALQTGNFAALLTFLEGQGNVQVLSSPRIATLNNQKAILKVGRDEFFVTNVTSTTTATAAGSQTSPTVTTQPFFSGIVLDVTPQIDDSNNIILHVHPSITEVTESTRTVSLGGSNAPVTLPLAKSTVNETDTIVRVQDGNIVAIGGLMSLDVRDTRGGVPGVPDSGFASLFLRNTSKTSSKKELVILLKPTLIQSDRDWEDGIRETRERMQGMRLPVGR